MSTDAAPLGALIGSRVRSARQELSWTLDQLADRSGVSRRMLVSVEQGATNPSIATLLRISDALGVGLPALVAPAEDTGIHVSRTGDRDALWTGAGGGRAVLAVGTEPPDVLELWDWSLGPAEEHTSEAHSTGTRELVLVLAGVLRLQVADELVDLAEGDAAAFPGDVPHAYRNPTGELVRFVLSVFEPGVGTGVSK